MLTEIEQEDLLVLQEAKRRHGLSQYDEVDRIVAGLFDRQRAFISDPSTRKTALCSRRAGKTHAAGAYLIKESIEHADCLSVYITISRKVARRLIWPMLKRFDRQFGLGLEFHNTELEATFPNGSQIWATGASNKEDIDKLRGNAYRLIMLDECASFGVWFAELIEEVLDPALADYNGTMAMIGTPSAACSGIFFEATTGAKDETGRTIRPGWAQHAWTVLDNPKFPIWHKRPTWRTDAQDWLEYKKQEKGWVDHDPIYLREWRGQWIRSTTSLVYKYDPQRNGYHSLPDLAWRYVLGVDLGYDDDSAFSVVAFSEDSATAYLVEDFKQPGLITDDIAKIIHSYRDKYDIARIVVDSGGLGRMIVEEMRRRHRLPVQAAEKSSKRDFI